MGNQLAQPLMQSAQPSEYLSEVPHVVYKDSLGGGRFLKTVRCVHDEGEDIVVKIYFKREDSPDLAQYDRRLQEIARSFNNPRLSHQHVWPFQRVLQTDKAVYLLRQFIFSDLHTRVLTRPFLSLIEKKWLAYQLIFAAAQVRPCCKSI
jgi:phosphoinositide-3-kinase regulatory subunit 4